MMGLTVPARIRYDRDVKGNFTLGTLDQVTTYLPSTTLFEKFREAGLLSADSVAIVLARNVTERSVRTAAEHVSIVKRRSGDLDALPAITGPVCDEFMLNLE